MSFVRSFVMYVNMISDTKRKHKATCIWEKSAEENIKTGERGSNRKLEKIE
jgi:hypothetical protein